MTLAAFFLITLLIGFALLKRVHGKYFLFKITSFLVGAFISSLIYFIFPRFFYSLDFDLLTFEFWEEAMAMWLFQDAIITGILYSSLIFILTDLLLKRYDRFEMFYNRAIIWSIFLIAFLIVFFNVVSDFSGLNLSPTFWFD